MDDVDHDIEGQKVYSEWWIYMTPDQESRLPLNMTQFQSVMICDLFLLEYVRDLG